MLWNVTDAMLRSMFLFEDIIVKRVKENQTGVNVTASLLDRIRIANGKAEAELFGAQHEPHMTTEKGPDACNNQFFYLVLLCINRQFIWFNFATNAC